MTCKNNLLHLNNLPDNHLPQKTLLEMPSEKEIWRIFSRSSYAQQLHNTDHNTPTFQNPYHEEGSIFNHTQLVYSEMNEYCLAHQITGTPKQVCQLLALCHDLGKPITKQNTVLPDGQEHVFFKNHAAWSALFFLQLTQQQRLAFPLIQKGWYWSLLQAIQLHDQTLTLHSYLTKPTEEVLLARWQKFLTYQPQLRLLLPAICYTDTKGRQTKTPRSGTKTTSLFEKVTKLPLNLPPLVTTPFFSTPSQIGDTQIFWQNLAQQKQPLALLWVDLPLATTNRCLSEGQQILGDKLVVLNQNDLLTLSQSATMQQSSKIKEANALVLTGGYHAAKERQKTLQLLAQIKLTNGNNQLYQPACFANFGLDTAPTGLDWLSLAAAFTPPLYGEGDSITFPQTYQRIFYSVSLNQQLLICVEPF